MRALALLLLLGCDGGAGDDPPVPPDSAGAACLCDAPTPDTLISPAGECRGVSPGTACLAGEACWIEGTGTCDLQPPGGGCSCEGGHWSCFSGCPGGCPEQRPSEGDPCDAAGECRYQGGAARCECVSGSFVCTP